MEFAREESANLYLRDGPEEICVWEGWPKKQFGYRFFALHGVVVVSLFFLFFFENVRKLAVALIFI